MQNDRKDLDYQIRFSYFFEVLNEEDPFRKWKAVEALARLAERRL